VPKWTKTYLTYDVTHKKQTKFFFSLQTRRLATSSEGLNSSLVQSAEELWSCKVMAFYVAHAGLKGKTKPSPMVLTTFNQVYFHQNRKMVKKYYHSLRIVTLSAWQKRLGSMSYLCIANCKKKLDKN